MELVRQVNTSPYRSVRSFVYTAVLSQRQKLMLTRAGYSPNLRSIFHYRNYQIEQDNEKNYASYAESVRLYMRLREYLKNAEESDIPLSDYCFSVCSNLSEWYYFHADMEDLTVPESAAVRLRSLLPVGFPGFPEDAYAQELGKLWLSEDISIEERILSEAIAKNADILPEYLRLLAEECDTRPLHQRLCALSDLAVSSTNMALAAELLWEASGDWLEEGMIGVGEWMNH